MTKTILAATDGSDHAERAVEVAAAIADIYDAKLILVHVLPDVVNEHLPEHLEKLVEFERLDVGEALNAIGESIIHQAQQKARKQGVKDIEIVLTTGSPAKEILEIAGRLDVDFIVMGSRGRGDLEGLLIGSVSHKVSHLAKQTCITVK
jgi:nucleotide-binding universal stress UspA family protein